MVSRRKKVSSKKVMLLVTVLNSETSKSLEIWKISIVNLWLKLVYIPSNAIFLNETK